MKLNFSLKVISFLYILALTPGCSENSSDPDPKSGRIYGVVTFLDGTPGKSALIDLKTLPINNHRVDIADENGEYSFDELYGADYVLTFQSTGSEINRFETELSLEPGEEIRKDITITYSILEESLAKSINEDVVMIMFEPNSAHIGDNFDLISYLSGGYYRDMGNIATLSAEVYLVPETIKWWETEFEITADSIRNNFEYVMDIEEETNFGNHTIRIEGKNIPLILSNPKNGFAFVKKGEDNKALKIPCVDFNNNDFGLQIHYK